MPSIDNEGRMSRMRQDAEVDAHPEDPRTLRTRKLLQDAFVELIQRQSFESITVGQIAAAATVNRATFYRHFRDKYHLVEELFTGAFNEVFRISGPPESHIEERIPTDPLFQRAFASLFNHVADNDRLYRALFSVSGEPSFRRRIHEQIVSSVKSRVQAGVSLSERGLRARKMKMPESDIPFDFVASLLFGIIAWWLEEGRRYSVDQVAEWARKFLRTGFIGLIED